LIAITLCIAVYFFWMSLFPPPQPVAPVVDGTADVPSGEAPASPETPATPAPTLASTPAPAPAVVDIPEHIELLSGEKWTGEVHSYEGAIRGLDLNDYTSSTEVTPLYSWLLGGMKGSDGWEPYRGGDDPLALLTEQGALLLAGSGALSPSLGYQLSERDGRIIATHTDPAGLTITKEFSPSSNPFSLDIQVTFANNSDRSIDQLWVGVVDEMSGDAGRFSNAIRPLAHVEGGIEHFDDLDDLSEQAEVVPEPPNWFGVGDRYFMSVLWPDAGSMSGLGSLVVAPLATGQDRYGSFAYFSQPLDAGATRTLKLHAYLGPKQLDVLESIDSNAFNNEADGVGPMLADVVELGWFGFFVCILFWMLKIF
jgi:hypothetical protein